MQSAKAAADIASNRRRGIEKELQMCTEQHQLNASSIGELVEQLDAARAHRSTIQDRLKGFQTKFRDLQDERKRLEGRMRKPDAR